MSSERIVIVGAGPAGLSTARSYRESEGTAEVTLVGAETFAPYERPPLTKELLRGELATSELSIEPEEWFEANDVKLLLGSRVSAIDPHRCTVTLDDHIRLPAETIVLATGSEPVRPPIPGLEHPNVHTIRALPDSEGLIEATAEAERVLVIGTGFIGCEIAASLAMRGLEVSLIGEEELPQQSRLGSQAAAQIARWLQELGVQLIGGASVSSVEEGQLVELENGERIEGSLVVLGTGVRPRGELAQTAGLEMNEGAVVVDETMRASGAYENVLAVGDIAYAFNAAAGRHLRVEHWGDALGQGEVAGQTLAGARTSWESVPGFWSTIGRQTLKHAAWGDGFDESRLTADDDGFTVWYERGGAAVGVLTHGHDADYERGRELIGQKAPPP